MKPRRKERGLREERQKRKTEEDEHRSARQEQISEPLPALTLLQTLPCPSLCRILHVLESCYLIDDRSAQSPSSEEAHSFPHSVLQLLADSASVDASLEHIPQVLNRVEIRTPGWPSLLSHADRVGDGRAWMHCDSQTTCRLLHVPVNEGQRRGRHSFSGSIISVIGMKSMTSCAA